MEKKLILLAIIAVCCLAQATAYAQYDPYAQYGKYGSAAGVYAPYALTKNDVAVAEKGTQVNSTTNSDSSSSDQYVFSDEKTYRETTYTYNAYGVMTSSTDDVTVTTTSTDQGKSSTQVQHSITYSQWMGGSVKPVSTSGTTQTTNAAGTVTENGTFWQSWQYEPTTGRLVGSTGGGESSQYNDETGKLSSHTTSTDTYAIMDGKAMIVRRDYTGTGYGDDGSTANSSLSGSTTYEYARYGGSLALVSTTSTNGSTMTSGESKGSSSSRTEIQTYIRNADGVLTGLSLSGYGTATQAKDGGSDQLTSKLTDYKVSWDPKKGYYISKKTWSEWN